jgi:hypothetical protein
MQSNASEIVHAPITIGRMVRAVRGERMRKSAEQPHAKGVAAGRAQNLEINPMQSNASQIASARHHDLANRGSVAVQ